MKNLVLTNHKVFRVRQSTPPSSPPQQQLHPTTPPTELNLDPSHTTIALDHTKQIIYYVDDELTLQAYHLTTKTNVLSIPLITPSQNLDDLEQSLGGEQEEDCDVDQILLPGDRIVNIQYVAENESVVIIATSEDLGQIISVSTAGIISKNLPTAAVNTTTTMTPSGDITVVAADEEEEDDLAAMGFLTMDNSQQEGLGDELGMIEIIGQIEQGFSAAQWSPDHELLVIACNNGNIIVMSNQFDVIGESPVTGQLNQQQQLATSNPYVHLQGTIQNKEYNELAKANQLLQTDIERDITISWRGDSQYFVTSSIKVDPRDDSTKRTLRVWTRQCSLTSQSEPVLSTIMPNNNIMIKTSHIDINGNDMNAYDYHQGMSRHLAWRPSGNIIATIITTRHIHGNTATNTIKTTTPQQQQQYLIQQNVQFYERNGLQRYSFPLHEPTLPSKSPGYIIMDMRWNSDSSILAISMYDLSLHQLVIKCFMVKNYHWACKQTYYLPMSTHQLHSVKFLWQYNRSTRLIILSSNDVAHCIDLVEDNHISAAPLYTNAVIDGRTVGLTHFSKAAIPPPLSSRSLLFHHNIIDVHLSNTVNPQSITYENSCICSIADNLQHRLATASTNGMRLDIVSPMVALTAKNELIFPTDAVEFNPAIHHPSYLQDTELFKQRMTYNQNENTIKATPFAPDYQPERQQGLNRAVSSSRPIAFAAISLQDVVNFMIATNHPKSGDYSANPHHIDEIYWRHIQWVLTDQWRAMLTTFTLQVQEEMISQGLVKLSNYLFIKRDMTSNNNNSQVNVVTVIETHPDCDYDTLVIISFKLDFIYHPTSSTWAPEVDIVNVEKIVLESTPSPTSGVTVTTTTPIEESQLYEQQLSTPAIEICPSTISRVYTMPHSLPFPVPPEPDVIDSTASPKSPHQSQDTHPNNDNNQTSIVNPNPNEPNQQYLPIDPQIDLDWYTQHQLALDSPPLLSLLTSHGDIIQIPITSTTISTSVTTTTQTTTLKSQLVPDCLFFMTTSMCGEVVFIGLDQQQRLMINKSVIAPQCMSFSLANFSDVQASPLPSTTINPITSRNTTGHGQVSTHVSNQQLSQLSRSMCDIPYGLFPSYLLVTVASQQHALFTVDLQRSIDDNINPMSPVRQDSHFVRVIERGSRIVQVIPDVLRPRVILQQPRGNIEVITPRSMGLAAIFIALLSKQYQMAFRSLRTNKIDLNLLIDHNKQEFIDNVVPILRDLYLPDNITLLLSSLTKEDCTFLSMENNQYPRYHSMFISQHTMKRLITLVMKKANGDDNDSAVVTSSSVTPIIFTIAPNGGDIYGNGIITNVDTDVSTSPLTIMDTFIGTEVNPTSHQSLELDPFGNPQQQLTMSSNLEDFDLLRKQLQSKNQQQKAEKNTQEHKIKSTAQGFSNRTRAHQAMGNDTTNDNNKYQSNLGEEAGMLLTADGTGQVYQQHLSRVEHWGVGEMDIRHVYSSAERLFNCFQSQPKQGSLSPIPFTPPSSITLQTNQQQPQQQQQQQTTQQQRRADSTKINTICDTILHALTTTILFPETTPTTHDQLQQYLLSILTAHLRKSPPDFVNAMMLLQTIAASERAPKIKANQLSGVGSLITLSSTPLKTTIGPHPNATGNNNNDISLHSSSLPSISAQKALKYMLILADKDELWKGALSTYDLTLAQSVAEHSGRDPKEYIPFLTTLNNIKRLGPALTTIQTTSVLVQGIVEQVVGMTKNYSTLFDQVKQFKPTDSTTTTELLSPTPLDLNSVELPPALGAALQRAYVDIYLKQSHNVVINFNAAIKAVQTILQQPTLEALNQLYLIPGSTHQSSTSLTPQTAYSMLIKLGFIVSSIYKLVIEYTSSYPYLNHLVIHLYCSPLPPAIPPNQPAPIDTTQPIIPSPTPNHSNTIYFYQYRILNTYAMWLVENQQYNDAAHIYLHLGHINDAVTCWANSGDWRNVLIYVQRYTHLFPLGSISNQFNQMELSTNSHHTKIQLYTKLSNTLLDQFNPILAAQIMYDQLRQYELSFATLLNAKEWKQAMLYATNHLAQQQYQGNVTNVSFENIFAKPLLTYVEKEVNFLNTAIEQYQAATQRLRLVRLVKQIIFGAQGGNKQCVQIYNKGAIDLGNVTGLIPQPRLMMRIPSDDVLEFIITGCWRGVATGLDVNGGGLNGSIGGFSTATGVTLLSLAPSVAQSIQSMSSALSGKSNMSQFSNGRLSNGSAMSSSQGSTLSLGAAETALTADERRLKKHMDKIKNKQGRKKVRGGDPREEEKLLLDIAYFTPRENRLRQLYELIEVLTACQLPQYSEIILSKITEYQRTVQQEESSPMYIIDTLSEWQQAMIKETFNWPMSNYLKSELEITQTYKQKEKEEHDDKLRQDLAKMNKQQKQEWEKSQALTVLKNVPLHVHGHRPSPIIMSMTSGNDVKDIEKGQNNKGQKSSLTHEQRANQNSTKQLWKSADLRIASLTSSLSTLAILTSPHTTTTTTTTTKDVTVPHNFSTPTPEHEEKRQDDDVYNILLNQILIDLHSIRRTTQLRMDHNPFGQKSQSQKIIDHLTQ